MTAPLLTPLRQRLLPRGSPEPLKVFWRRAPTPATFAPATEARLRDIFDADLAQLGEWLGVRLDCETFRDVTGSRPLEWAM